MKDSVNIEQRIAQEQAKIRIPSYQEVAWDGAWKKRSAATWGLGFFGLATGAFIGAVAPIAPALFADVPATGELFARSIAIFSALGISGGMAVANVVAPAAGAAAATAKEVERRQIGREIEEALLKDPGAKVEIASTSTPLTEMEPAGLSRYVNLSTGVLFALIGAAAGAVFAAGLAAAEGTMLTQMAMPAMDALGISGAAAATSYSAGLGAAFGSIFGLNYPLISNKLVTKASEFLSGKAIGAPWPDSANLPDLKPILAPNIEHSPEYLAKQSFVERLQQQPQELSHAR